MTENCVAPEADYAEDHYREWVAANSLREHQLGQPIRPTNLGNGNRTAP